MSWFDTKGLASLAKTALKEAQKQIDKALDIQEENVNLSMGDDSQDFKRVAGCAKKRLPGGANREHSKTAPDTPNIGDITLGSYVKSEDCPSTSSLLESRSNWGLFTNSFFDNANSNEMVTTPPKVGNNADITAVAIPSMSLTTSISISPFVLSTPIPASVSKRQSVTSNSDSVDLLSPPTSPCSEFNSNSDTAINNSESVELITATSLSGHHSPECSSSLPESIVIIASNEAVDNEEDSISYNTVLDDTLIAGGTDLLVISQQHTILNKDSETKESDTETPRLTVSALGHSTTSGGTLKLYTSSDKVGYESFTVDSDSTQSFEDVQIHSNDLQYEGAATLHTLARDVRVGLKSSTSQTYFSPHNSNDEMETATSSDIEIISNPNGDSSSTNSTTRTSPLKLKRVVQLQGVMQGSAAHMKKGHYREVSETSILSEDSQLELEKLVTRISELNEILEGRELRLLHSERQNIALQDRNNDLQAVVDAMRATGNVDASEDYTQRLSALEKKFQASIRERDSLRSQVKALKDELQSKIPKNDLTQIVAEKNRIIEELRLEGEKLSKEILQQSTILKKLRTKEKSSDSILKKNKEQISSLADELERSKKILNAKEDVERSQIEAVHKMSSEKRKLEEEHAQQCSKMEVLVNKLATLQNSFDAAKMELQQRSRIHTDLMRITEEAQEAKKETEMLRTENQKVLFQLSSMREKLRNSEAVVARREQQFRDDNKDFLRRLEAAELRAESSTQEVSLTAVPLMRQLEALESTLIQRTNSWNKQEKAMSEQIDLQQTRLKALENIESNVKDKITSLHKRCTELEENLSNALFAEEKAKVALHRTQHDRKLWESNISRQISSLEETLAYSKDKIKVLELKNKILDELLQQKSQNNGDCTATVNDFGPRQFSPITVNDTAHINEHQPRSQSPANSCGVNSLDETMGGNVDWHIDDSECVSNPGQSVGSFAYGINLNFLGHNTTTLEHLQSLLKQRDGELTHLQWEVSRLQAERNALTEEISNITAELDNVKEKLHAFEMLEKIYCDLQHRYDALLQMYGEKVERTEELELDLVELKEAYKAQIDELLAQPQPTF